MELNSEQSLAREACLDMMIVVQLESLISAMVVDATKMLWNPVRQSSSMMILIHLVILAVICNAEINPNSEFIGFH